MKMQEKKNLFKPLFSKAITDQVRSIFHLKPVEHFHTNGIDGLFTITKLVGNFLAVIAISNQVQDLQLFFGDVSFFHIQY